jgi:hypothetical protein
VLQQLRQLGDVYGDAPRLVAGEQVCRRTPSRLLLEIDVGERLPVVIADDEVQASVSSAVQGGGKRRAVIFDSGVPQSSICGK